LSCAPSAVSSRPRGGRASTAARPRSGARCSTCPERSQRCSRCRRRASRPLLDERTISARAAGEGDEIFSGSPDHDQGIITAATSDIDGDGVREAVVAPQTGDDTGPLLYVVRFAPGRPTEILFRWDCRS
jgi:hypothetical protein